jgi:hypothetical protein
VLTEGARRFFGDKYDRALEVIVAGQSIQCNSQADRRRRRHAVARLGPVGPSPPARRFAVDGSTVMV